MPPPENPSETSSRLFRFQMQIVGHSGFLCQLALTIARIFGEWKIVKLLGLNLPFGHLNDTNFQAKFLAEKRKNGEDFHCLTLSLA